MASRLTEKPIWGNHGWLVASPCAPARPSSSPEENITTRAPRLDDSSPSFAPSSAPNSATASATTFLTSSTATAALAALSEPPGET